MPPHASVDLASAFARFVAKEYKRRVVALDCDSVYNQNYVCHVSALVFTNDEIRVRFDVRGNNSLGPLQEPDNSVLLTLRAPVGQPHTRLCEPWLGALDPSSKGEFTTTRKQGELVYRFEPRSPSLRGGELHFSYGNHGYFIRSGYGLACLARLTDAFVEKHHLGHLHLFRSGEREW